VDTVGELAQMYSVADVVFVGGSLVPLGGHNVLEAALRRKPVLMGPHTDNFARPPALEPASGPSDTAAADGSPRNQSDFDVLSTAPSHAGVRFFHPTYDHGSTAFQPQRSANSELSSRSASSCVTVEE